VCFKEKILAHNNTFCGGEPCWANACVGNNGNPSYVEYSKGFSQAANVLIDLVLSDHGINYLVDDLIYPVCFNMRHSIELRLKGAIEEVVKISEIKGAKLYFDLPASHNIGKIWEFFRYESEKIDRRYIRINERLASIINDVSSVDSTGQTFRYPVDKESQKHLTDISNINFLTLKIKFNELEADLDTLHRINIFLKEEYRLNTFTRSMSRADLFDLANELPKREAWNEDGFKETKLNLREKYSLSSNELSKAINIISNNYEMAEKIGIVLPLLALDYEILCLVLDRWIRVNPRVSNRNLDDNSFEELDFNNLSDLVKTFEISKNMELNKEDVWSELSSVITPEILAGLKSLFYFKGDFFSEYYIYKYEFELTEAKLNFGSERFKESFLHLYSKANLIDCFILSIFKLGNKNIAERIIEKYGLEDAFEWITEVREGRYFSMPEVFGYR
jgi:hypothetical protein